MEADNSLIQLVTFWIGGRWFGVDIGDVKEVNDEMRITPVFHAGAEIKGYVNIRGQVYIVIDPAAMLGIGFHAAESPRLLLFKSHIGELLAVMVDKIGDVMSISGRYMEQYQAGQADMGIYRGICRLAEGILVILEAGSILSKVEHLRGN